MERRPATRMPVHEMSAPIRLGLVGCGRAAERLHAPAVARSGKARLAAVADHDVQRAKFLAEGFPVCRVFRTVEELVDSGMVDAVIVAVPPEHHVRAARLSLIRHLPTLVEKPLARSLSEVEDLAEVEAASEGFVMMGYNRRWIAPLRRLRELIAAAAARAPMRARLELTTNVEAWSPVSAAADPLDDLASHQVDLLRFLFRDEISVVSAHQEGEGAVRLTARLRGGVTAEARAAHASGYSERVSVSLAGGDYAFTAGSYRLAPAAGSVRSILDVADRVVRSTLRRANPLRRSFDQQLAAFLSRVSGVRGSSEGPLAAVGGDRDGGGDVLPGLRDGIAALRAIDAARRSLAAGGREMTVRVL